MGKKFGSVLEMQGVTTPGATPPSGSYLLYFKADGLLYKRDGVGAEAVVAGGGVSRALTIAATAPANPAVGDQWLDPAPTTVSSDNFVVSATNPGLVNPGLWVQTGLGSDGTGVTFWIEDGT